MTLVVTAVIVNYNAGDELRHALQSIAADLGERPWEAVVVDNASVDGSGDIVAEFAPHATLIRNVENVGFGRAVNQGLARATAPLVLVMNPDCRLLPGALAVELERHETCALLGPRILNPDGTEQGSARGDPDILTGVFGRTSWFRRMFPGLAVSARNVVQLAPTRDTESVAVDWVSGACFLARVDRLRAVGGFDERYFLYWEDADLCRRLRGTGAHIRHVPSAAAVHQVGHSSRTARVSSVKAFHASAYRYYATHVAPRSADPRRWLARAILWGRCRWLLMQR
jgi:GT2 family glycosyltransferase